MFYLHERFEKSHPAAAVQLFWPKGSSSLTTATGRSCGSRPMATQKKITWMAGSRKANRNWLKKERS